MASVNSALSSVRFAGCGLGVDRSITDFDGEKLCCVALVVECTGRSCDATPMLLLGLKFVLLADVVVERAGVRGADGSAIEGVADGSPASRFERRSRASATIRMAVFASAENSCGLERLSLRGGGAMSRAVQILRTVAT